MSTEGLYDQRLRLDFYIIAHGVACAKDVPYGSFIPVLPKEEGTFTGGSNADCLVDVSGFGRNIEFTAYPVPFDKEVNIKYAFDFDTNVKIEVFRNSPGHCPPQVQHLRRRDFQIYLSPPH